MYSSRRQRFLVRIHKVLSKTNPDMAGRKSFILFMEENNFSLKALYSKYNVPEIDRGIIERGIEYLARNQSNVQHRRREISAIDMNDYEKAVYNAIKNGADKSDLLSSLGFLLPEDLYNSVVHPDLKVIVTELQ